MVVSEDKKGSDRGLVPHPERGQRSLPQDPAKRLDPELCYHSLADGNSYYGDELMYAADHLRLLCRRNHT